MLHVGEKFFSKKFPHLLLGNFREVYVTPGIPRLILRSEQRFATHPEVDSPDENTSYESPLPYGRTLCRWFAEMLFKSWTIGDLRSIAWACACADQWSAGD
jgi:hypothetical protein